jgi:predicted patatin/cPLA2 family phospholipase
MLDKVKHTFLPKAQLIFAGGGGKYNYSLGVLQYIQENFDLSDVVVSGSSSGCFPAVVAVSGLDSETMFESWNVPLLNEVNRHTFGATAIWNRIVRSYTTKHIPPNTYMRANGRLFIQLTKFPSFEGELVSDWKSHNDMLDAMMASSFVPIFDMFKLTAKFRGNRFIDGSISDRNPTPFNSEIPSFVVRADMWRKMPNSYFWCWSDEAHARKLFAWGKEDAEKNIKEISKVLPPK